MVAGGACCRPAREIVGSAVSSSLFSLAPSGVDGLSPLLFFQCLAVCVPKSRDVRFVPIGDIVLL
jgi:hypothetical protein